MFGAIFGGSLFGEIWRLLTTRARSAQTLADAAFFLVDRDPVSFDAGADPVYFTVDRGSRYLSAE